MEIKKSPEADLEPYRGLWFRVGFIVALSLLFVAFEWSGQEETVDDEAWLSDWVFEEELDVPVIERPAPAPPPPPPPAAPPVKETQVTVVDNETETEEDEPLPSGQEEASEALPAPVPAAGMPEAEAADETVYVEVDELPEFPIGGQNGLMRYLTQHIRYPQAAWDRHIQGTVLCQFIVEANGGITHVQVLQGVHPWLDNEALRVLRGMPRWKPGKRDGRPVRVRYTLPVVFCLQ